MEIVVVLLCGLLGAWGGADKTSKSWRRIGIPLLLSLFAFFGVGWYCLPLLLLFAPLTLGYGRFDPQDLTPSTIGLWAFRKFPDNPMYQDILIRLSVSFLTMVALLPFMLFSQKWGNYAIVSVFYMSVSVLYGAIAKNEGMVKVFGKDLLVEEFIIYASLGTTCLI